MIITRNVRQRITLDPTVSGFLPIHALLIESAPER